MLSRGIELTARTSVASDNEKTREVPILGRVAAGIPLLATENLEGHIRVDRTMARRTRRLPCGCGAIR